MVRALTQLHRLLYSLSLVCALLALPIGQLTADEPIEKLILQLDQPLPAGRADAARKLAQYGQSAAIATDALIRALSDQQADMRINAAYALGCVQTDSPRVLASLVPLLSDSDEHVRYSVQWSIAQIAKSLKPEQDVEAIQSLTSSLRQALKEIRPREHQDRHVIAVELALSRLEQMTPPKVINVPVPQPVTDSEEIVRAKAMAESLYQATDAAGRFQFVRRLSNMDAYPDSIRRIVLEKESRQADPSVLHYAVQRWGGRARMLLADILQARLESGWLVDEDVTLLGEMIPSTRELREQVMRIARDEARSDDLRWAALSALSRSPEVEPELIDQWLQLIENSETDSVLTGDALEALAELGSRAFVAQPRLLAQLPRFKDEVMLDSLARALVAVAPGSAAVASALSDRLRQTSVDSPLYVDLINACSSMGPSAASFQAEFTRGLVHTDVYTRGRCVEAISRIGTCDPSTINALLDRISDQNEEVSIKNQCAETLAKLGTPGQQALGQRLELAYQANNQAAMKDIMCALAITGSQNDQTAERCLTILSGANFQIDLRVAAATALGSMRPATVACATQLNKLCSEEHDEGLRSAALLSLAHLDPASAPRHFDSFETSDSILLRASAAYARHLTDDSKQAFDKLIGLINGSPTDEVISRCLTDMGDSIEPWLLAVAADTSASPAAREICYTLACELPHPDWSKLLPMVEDADLGNRFVIFAEGPVQTDEGIEAILRLLDSGRMKPSVQSRLIDMLFPDGLGGGDMDQDWKVLTLQQPSARAALAQSSSVAMPGAPAEEPTGGSAAEPEQVQREPVMPRIEVPIADMTPRETPELVKVFYGTNRGRTSGSNDKQETAIAVLATAGGGMLAMLFCLVGFIRSGHRFYAVMALLTMGLAAPFGYQAALKYSGDALRPSVNYDGTYCKEIELGVCQVSIPPGHKPGELEAPQLFQLQFKQELDKHVVLTEVTPLDKNAFFGDLKSTLSAKGKNILVFIHGYNVSFEDAARRTAQMSFDLKFAGAPVFYSWPSQANWYGYPTDRENIELSVNQIKQFLLDLARQSGAETINLVAHSMGNVGLTQALKEIEQDSPEPLFNQVVLAAPDIDADIFKERIAPEIVSKAKHVTLYTSQTDLALIASRYFNNGPRVGDSTGGVPLFDRIETIDATSIDSSLIGHSYYGSNVTVLTDLGNVLMNRPASSREYLQTILSTPQPHWTFDATRLSQSPDHSTTR